MASFLRAARAFGVFAFIFFYNLAATYAATEYLPENFFLQPADVNGDARMDTLAQPWAPGTDAAVLLGFGLGADAGRDNNDPELLWQRLNDIDPELEWDNHHAVLLAEDFNGDGRDDLYLQGREASSLQAVLIANAAGRFTAAQQKFAGDYMGVDWAADLRHATSGDFDGNGRGEVLLQGYSAADIHLIVRPNADGMLNTSGPAWMDGHLGLRFNARDIELHAGDFNGDGREDLLWRHRAQRSPAAGEPAVALLLADANGGFNRIDQQWEADFLGAAWDAGTHAIRIADINNDGIADIVLRARGNGTHYLVPGQLDGRFTEIALEWQGEPSAEQAWAARPAGTADVVVHAGQTVASHSAGSPVSGKLASAQMQSGGASAGDAVGSLPGEFSVDPTGAANYRIPIDVPPGVGGMQPDLAFLYSSRAGNGLLGVGWSLSGLSAITRCPRSIAQTGTVFEPVAFEKTDAFCLDGQLLHAVSGEYGAGSTVYGTEISSFQRVESFGGNNSTDPLTYTGPQHFIVKDKAGLIREYGKTADSRIAVAGRIVVKQWSLNKIRDRFGNSIHFTYQTDAQDDMQSYSPKQVAWYNRSGALIGKVELIYEDRPDITRGYEPFNADHDVAGNSLFKRLDRVKVFARDAFVREYRIGYTPLAPSGVSAIRTVTLCAASGTCLPATTFDWSGGTTEMETDVQELKDILNVPLTPRHIGDFNGDGRSDVIYPANGRFYYYDIAADSHVDTGISTNALEHAAALVFDVDRSGRADVLVSGSGTWRIVSQEDSGSYSIRSAGAPSLGWNKSLAPIDVNNDGYPELLYMDNGSLYFYWNDHGNFDPVSEGIPSILLGDEQRIVPIEYNGDGRTDFLLTAKSDRTLGRIFVSTGEGFWPADQDFDTTFATPIDFNGDGLTDLVAKGGPLGTDEDNWYTFLNVGGEFVNAGLRPTDIDHEDHKKVQVADLNGDGVSDLFIRRAHGVYGFWGAQTYDAKDKYWRSLSVDASVVTETPDSALFLEYDGDGIVDAMFKDNDVWKFRAGGGEVSGLLLNARNGLGDVQTVAYWQLNRRPPDGMEPIYLGHAPAEVGLPYYTLSTEILARIGSRQARYVSGPIPVVASIQIGTGVRSPTEGEGRIRTSYQYAGAIMDATGRGFLGFRMMQVKNSNTGIETVNLHRQVFPYTGMIETALQKIPDTSVTRLAPRNDVIYCDDYSTDPCGFELIEETETVAGKLVSETTNTFGQATATADGGLFPYVASTVEKRYRFPWDDAGEPPVEAVTETTYTYGVTTGGKVTGDPTQIVVKTTTDGAAADLHRVDTVNQYAQNDIGSHWCLGRLTHSDVTHQRTNYRNANSAIPLTQTTAASFTYDQDVHYTGNGADEKSCRLETETAYAGVTALEVTKTHQFDAFGNTRQTIVATADGTRSTTQTYDHYGLFPRMTANDLGHQEFYVWDHRFGVKRSSTGPNGLTTVWEYDGFGKPLRETAPRAAVSTSYEYQWCDGNCISDSAVYYTRAESTAGTAAYTLTEYDSLGREVATRAPDMLGGNLITKETVYDSLGRAYLVSLPYVNTSARCWSQTIYDLLGRPLTVSQPATETDCASTGGAVLPEDATAPAYGKTVTYAYPTGFRTDVTDPMGRTKTTVANVLGRTLYVRDNDDTALTTYFDYDALGNTTTVEPPDSGIVHVTYDAAGRKTAMTDPDMGTWTYGYTAFGELEWQQDALGNRTEMTYDALGRMLARIDTPHNGTPQATQWTYDKAYGAGIGKPATVTGADGYAESYAYNEYGQATDTVRLMDGEIYWTSQTYDERGRPDILVYPDVESFTASTAPALGNLAIGTSVNGRHTVSWQSDSDFAQYTLYRTLENATFDPGAVVYTGPLAEFTDQVTENGEYRYWVKGCHGAQCSTPLGPSSITIALPPSPPDYLVVEGYDANHDGAIALSWGASVGATEYRLERDDAFDGNYPVDVTIAGTSTSVTGLGDGVYHFRISACNLDGCGTPVMGLNPATVLSYPQQAATPTVNRAIMATDETAEVTWTLDPGQDANINEYDVEVFLLDTNDVPALQYTVTETTNSHLVQNPAPGRYRFAVRLCKALASGRLCSTQSSGLSTVLDAGERPAALAELNNPPSNTGSTFNLTFDNPQSLRLEDFRLYESTNANFDENVRGPLTLSEPTCYDNEGNPLPSCPPPDSVQVTGATSGLKWYRINACNTYGCSAWTETAQPTDVLWPPGIPGAITAPTLSSDGDYTVSWQASTSGTVDQYRLYEGETIAIAEDPQTTPVYTGAALDRNFSKPDGTRLYYAVRACYKNHCSNPVTSNAVSVIYPPLPPATFNISPNNSDGSYQLNWTNVPSVTDYVLQEFTDPNLVLDDNAVGVNIPVLEAPCAPEDQEPDGTCTHLPYDDNAANISGRGEGTYYYRVKTCNGGGCSDWKVGSNGITVLHVPGIPGSITVPASSAGSHTVTWTNASGSVTRYELYEAGNPDFIGETLTNGGGGTAVSKPVSGKADGSYYYRVRACNASGCGGMAEGGNGVVVINLPGNPGLMTAPTSTNTTGSYAISWDAASGIVHSYTLQQSTSSTFASVTGITVPPVCIRYSTEPGQENLCEAWGPGTSVTVSGRASGTYYYRVQACNSSGCSGGWSESAPVTVLRTPGVPGSITVPATSDGSHTVTWTAASGSITRYELYEADNPDFTGQTLVNSGGGTALSKPASGKADDTYYYRVRACNAASCGGWIEGGNGVVVINLPGTPGAMTVPTTTNTTGSYDISWSAASGIVQSYTLQQSTSSTFASVTGITVPPVCIRYSTEPGQENLCEAWGPGTSVTVSDRASGTYYYRVQACNSSGCSGGWSESTPVTVLRTPGVPASITVPSGSNGSHSVSWTAGSGTISEYQLYESVNSNFSGQTLVYSGASLSKALGGRANDTYYYRVRACNASGCSGYRTGGNGTIVVNPPGTPGAIVAPNSNASGSYDISWSAASGSIGSYELQESASSSFASVTGINVPDICIHYSTEPGQENLCEEWGAGTSVEISGRSNGTYYYRVRACNTSGCGGWSTDTTGVSVLHLPGTPGSITVPVDSNGSHTITWTGASGSVAHYELQEDTSSGFGSPTLVNGGGGTATSKPLGSRADGSYYYRVRACNASGCGNWRTGGNAVVVINPPGLPGTLSFPSSNSTGSIQVSWGTAAGTVNNYTVQQATNSSFSGATSINVPRACIAWEEGLCSQWGAPPTSIIRSDLANGTYYYRVRACNTTSCSSWRDGSHSVVVNRTPGVPGSISAPSSDSNGSYTVSWGSSSGTVTAYKLYEATNASFSGQTLAYSGTALSKAISGKSNGTYYYRVRACNGTYCSGYRSGASTTVSISGGGGGGGGGGCTPLSCDDPLSMPEDPAATSITVEGGISEAQPSPPATVNTAHNAALVKAGNTHAHNDFRAMPPMRPGEFYAQLRTGKPSATHTARQVRTAFNRAATQPDTAGTSPTEQGKASGQPLTLAERAAAQLTIDNAGNLLPGDIEPVAPLRNDPRITRNEPKAASSPSPSKREDRGDGKNARVTAAIGILKFGLTHEPSGTYAHAVQHVYHTLTGALVQVRECIADASDTGCDTSVGQVYWQATAVNTNGAITAIALGNGLTTQYSYNNATGALLGIDTNNGAATVQDLVYDWDIAGNLTARTDNTFAALSGGNGPLQQEFTYDNLHRLKHAKSLYNITAVAEDNRYTGYQKNGNIACFNLATDTCNTTAPDYTYDGSKFHAVANKTGSGSSAGAYTYNLNGSMLTGPNRSITWTSFNKVARIDNTASGAYAAFAYDPNRARYKQVTATATTIYVGALYERVEEGATTTHKFHIFAGGSAVAIYRCTTHCGEDPGTQAAGDTRDETFYFHKDHLGSISVITDGHGVEKERFVYTAWGEQQAWNNTSQLFEPASSEKQTRGYTGHEMLNELGLINMNGRIYDQNLGRFISADPFVQFPQSTQGYNRYAYLGNNPLNATDPSGYFNLRKEIGSLLMNIAPYLNSIPFCQVWCAAVASYIGGYLKTGSSSYAEKAAVAAAAGSAVNLGINSAYGATSQSAIQQMSTGKLIAYRTTQAVAQGALSSAGGGRFSDGFLGSVAGDIGGGNPIAAAIIGGTMAKIGGGRFASGAKSGFFHSLIGPSLTKAMRSMGQFQAVGAKADVNVNQASRLEKKNVGSYTQQEGETDIDFLKRTGKAMREFSDETRYEACGRVCTNGDSLRIDAITLESHIGCGVPMSCAAGYDPTHVGMHSHGTSGSFRANRADEVLSDGTMIKGRSYRGGDQYNFSTTDSGNRMIDILARPDGILFEGIEGGFYGY